MQMRKRWLLDREIEVALGGSITASRLRKDRLGKKLFPFHRVGRSVYYDLAEVESVIEAAASGGLTASDPKASGSLCP
jgi:hypothetical protein